MHGAFCPIDAAQSRNAALLLHRQDLSGHRWRLKAVGRDKKEDPASIANDAVRLLLTTVIGLFSGHLALFRLRHHRPVMMSSRRDPSIAMNNPAEPTRKRPRRAGSVAGSCSELDPAGIETCKDQLWAFAQQSLEHAILLIDTDNVVTWANPGAVDILGAAATDLAGHTIERFFTPEDVARGIPQHEIAVARSHGSAEDDRWMARADGSRFWASGLLVALREPGGAVVAFVKVLRDLTDVKMQLETLRNRSDRHRQLIATLSHELRNPLGSMGMASSVLRQLASGDERLHPLLEVLERNIGFVARLLEDLEDATRVGTSKLDLRPEPLLLHEVLSAAIEAARDRFAHSAHDIDLLLPAAAIVLQADRLRVQQVFVNLIGNAIKFTPQEGRIWVKAAIEGSQAVIRVEDAGAGIAPDDLEHIFEMFTQANPDGRGGLGIGLALVKEIVELHGGSVQARSEGIGKGSEFIVRLPLRQEAT